MLPTQSDQNNRSQERLLDSQIITVKSDRRSFLARAVGLGTLTFGSAFAAACGDVCTVDQDVTRYGDPAVRTDVDVFDPVGGGRFVDTDITVNGDPRGGCDSDIA